MLTAFVLYHDSSVETLLSPDAVETAWSKDGTVVWVDLEQPSTADIEAIRRLFSLDPEALLDCEMCELRPEVRQFENHLFFLWYSLAGREAAADPGWRKLRIFCGGRFLVTVHQEAIRVLQSVREHCSADPAQMLRRGVDFILCNIVDGIVNDYLIAGDAYQDRLDRAEEESLKAGVNESLLDQIGVLRRPLLQLHHLVVLQREILTPIVRGEYEYISENLERRSSHIRDHLAQGLTLVESLRELSAVIRDNYNATLASRLNETMKTLTVFASILLPLSLVTGFYGMNLALWPSPEDPFSILWVLGAMILLAVGLLVFFRRRGWL